MEIKTLIRNIVKRRAPIFKAGMALVALCIIYIAILRLPVFTPLNDQATFQILNRIISYLFILALATVVLSVVSYALIKLLPASFFEPIPKIQYSLGIATMFDPLDQNGMSRIADQYEIYPAFPFYSRESDHPTEWPPRIGRERHDLYQQYTQFISSFPIGKMLAQESSAPDTTKIEIFSGGSEEMERDTLQKIVQLRLRYNEIIQTDSTRLGSLLGKEAAERLERIEDDRKALRNSFPNRFALLIIKNAGKRNAEEVVVDFDVYGYMYDIQSTIAFDTRESNAINKQIVFQQIAPGNQIEIRLWYRYNPAKNNPLSDQRDYIIELTQGMIINYVGVSNGIAAIHNDLLKDFKPYERLYVGGAEKKQDYSSDLNAYFKKSAQELNKALIDSSKEHPSYFKVTTRWLTDSPRPDSAVNAIWISFQSKAGRRYTAVHAFKHPDGPYILLCSKDKDPIDFALVESLLEKVYGGKAEGKVHDRGDDIVDTIIVKNGFTQKGIATIVDSFYRETFSKVIIEAVHY